MDRPEQILSVLIKLLFYHGETNNNHKYSNIVGLKVIRTILKGKKSKNW